MTGAGTYWRTIRHLKARQLVDRITFRLRRPTPDMRPAPLRRAPTRPWVRPAQRAASLAAPATFDLLEERHALADIGWDDPARTKLWRYNQHYFDDLNALDAAQRSGLHAALIECWIEANAPGVGTGWEPYPVSLRVVNWIKWSLAGNDLSASATASLSVQVRWLTRRLETHLLGNHLLANAKALVFAGLFFEGAEAAAWLHTGGAILEREVPEQVLADGGQFELSPMYHALALEDVLDLVDIIGAAGEHIAAAQKLRGLLAAQTPAMLAWLLALSHPDGTLGRFNDCADGIAPPTRELLRLAAALGFAALTRDDPGLVLLPDSGYVRVERGPVVALLDIARVGPDYLPGHAHADTLSFELSAAGRRVIVNGGTSCYGQGAQRQRERSTAAHSTVEVDSENSSEVWAGFRVGRRARPSAPMIERTGDALNVSGSHDGYAHQPGRPVHRRRWRFEDRRLTVSDDLGACRLPAVARFHLAPGLELVPAGATTWAIGDGAVQIGRVEVIHGQGRVEASSYAPRFGVLCATRCLAVALDSGRATTTWTWDI